MALTLLSMPSDWRLNFGAISFYHDLIFMERVPITLDHYWYREGA